MGLERGVKKKLCKKLIKCFTLVLIAVNQFTYSCALPLVEPEGRDTSQSECLKSPETILIECRLVNVKDAVCIDKNVISIPSTPENDKEGEVNCTATQPIDMSFVGYQVRNANSNLKFGNSTENNLATKRIAVNILQIFVSMHSWTILLTPASSGMRTMSLMKPPMFSLWLSVSQI